MDRKVLITSLADLMEQVNDMMALGAQLAQAAVNVSTKLQECAQQVMAAVAVVLKELEKP